MYRLGAIKSVSLEKIKLSIFNTDGTCNKVRTLITPLRMMSDTSEFNQHREHYHYVYVLSNLYIPKFVPIFDGD